MKNFQHVEEGAFEKFKRNVTLSVFEVGEGFEVMIALYYWLKTYLFISHGAYWFI